MVRSGSEDLFPDDVSIIIGHNQKYGDKLPVWDMLNYTDLPVQSKVSMSFC